MGLEGQSGPHWTRGLLIVFSKIVLTLCVKMCLEIEVPHGVWTSLIKMLHRIVQEMIPWTLKKLQSKLQSKLHTKLHDCFFLFNFLPFHCEEAGWLGHNHACVFHFGRPPLSSRLLERCPSLKPDHGHGHAKKHQKIS